MRMGFSKRVRELWFLYQGQLRTTHNLSESVRIRIKQLQNVEPAVFEHTGLKITRLNILEIGSGQNSFSMPYFASQNNKVIGIDLNEIVSGFSLLGYYRIWQKNGLLRVIKTLGRKITGVDKKLNLELAKQLGVLSLPKLEVLNMDASNMSFPNASFGFIFSKSVFEHIPEPSKVIDEVIRILKPGGCVYLSVHLYTSDSGCHDPKIFSGKRSDIPLWAHLRPQYQAKVQPNAYLNKLSMNQWEQLFLSKMPGCFMKSLTGSKDRMADLIEELNQLRQEGELREYRDEELLTVDYVAIWQKPKSF